MEEKENVNQNPKIAEFSIQNNVCFPSSVDQARHLYDHFLSLARIRGVKVENRLGATMEVDLVNNDNGPVTIILDSRETVKSR
jgi:D-Tyr-tRNAtyr deacylase